MKFFLYVNPQTPGPESDAEVIRRTTDHVLLADRSGFDAVCLTEHQFTDYNTYGDAFMYAAYLAPQLKRATIILTAAVPALHNPMALAQKANLLDQLSEGKAIIGLATGGSPTEFKGMGRDPSRRRGLMEQVVDILYEAWSLKPGDSPLQYETEHDHGEVHNRIMPAPFQKSHPRLGRASTSEDGMLYAAKQGWPWFFGRYMPAEAGQLLIRYEEALRQAGHSDEVIKECLEWTLMQKIVCVADTDEQAFADLGEPLKLYGDIFKIAYPSDSPKDMSLDSGNTQPKMGVRAIDTDQFVTRAMIVGSPETVVARLKEYESAGIRNFTACLYFGNLSPEKLDRSMRLFTERVMPQFQRVDPI